MRHQLAQLGRNLRAGARLALFRSVDRLQFRIGIAELLVLFVLSALLDCGGDWIRYGPEAEFSLYGAGSELFSAGLLLLVSAALSLLWRQASLVVALPVMVLAALPTIQVAQAAVDAMRPMLDASITLDVLGTVFTAWLVVVLVRAVAVALERPKVRWWRATLGGLALAAPLWVAPAITLTQPWWKEPASAGAMDARFPNPASEPVLAAQAELLDGALSELDDERPGTTDLYFIAFGASAAEDGYRADVERARKVMDERWDAAGHSVTLLNNPATLLETPIATVTNLRETLKEMAGAMNTDEDIAMVYLAGPGAPESLAVSLPPLDLAPVTPVILRKLLDEAGITWRIVVISACYSGSFVPALKDDHTLVITATRADRASFGCRAGEVGTPFGEALFGEALAKADGWPAAFELAREAVAARERQEHVSSASEPQIAVGDAMAEKLKELERGSAARRSGRMVRLEAPTMTTRPLPAPRIG